VVAIDGPAGAGKSTVSRRVATELGYTLLDTGALYRCVGLAAARRDAVDDPQKVTQIAEQLARSESIAFEPTADGGQKVLLDGEDVSSAIRTPQAGTHASKVSAIPGVRQALLAIQRAVGKEGRVVVEGRDIGSVVFPDAEAKFFLTASVQERAARRFAELKDDNPDTTLSDVEDEVRERDHRDSMRPVAPLTQAPDARLVDSTKLGIDEVVAQIVAHVRDVERQLA
jgi:cytidylate kinase